GRWAGKCRNATLNGLPQCQLRIPIPAKSHLLHLSPSGWTLCVPVDSSAKAYRKKAIQHLGKTFREAMAVLILDRELEIVESANASFLEIGLRILCSGWVKRLWTLQEATLASEARGTVKLYFQMQDGPFMYQKYERDRKALQSPDGGATEIQAEERELLAEDGVMLELGSQIPSVRTMRDMPREGFSPFRAIYSALEHRSTSKIEDVPVCIVSILGKDLSTILYTSDEEQRVAQFFMLMREVPIGVLWSDLSTKLSIAPFRWALKSIASCPRTTYMDTQNGICDATGLHIRAGGFVFEEDGVELDALPPVF
ncbi:hypothetical protein K435DRAFT_939514, partial [Dendrothele bispora CBS 962.96]